MGNFHYIKHLAQHCNTVIFW